MAEVPLGLMIGRLMSGFGWQQHCSMVEGKPLFHLPSKKDIKIEIQIEWKRQNRTLHQSSVYDYVTTWKRKSINVDGNYVMRQIVMCLILVEKLVWFRVRLITVRNIMGITIIIILTMFLATGARRDAVDTNILIICYFVLVLGGSL